MKIMLFGSGPDRIGKTGELDRFAFRALRFLKSEGHETVWVDNNPMTLACVPSPSKRVFLEPLTLRVIEKIIERERPEGIMYGFGGCLAMRLVIFLEREGFWDQYGVKVLGTSVSALKRSMDAEIFKKSLRNLKVPFMEASVVHNLDECVSVGRSIGFPLILRPSFALEGIGGYVAYNVEEIKDLAHLSFNLSPVREVILEQVPVDWVQFAIEGIHDPQSPGKIHLVGTFEAVEGGVGVHPGNSILVAPSLTLKGGLLAQAWQLTETIAKFMEICGSFQVRFARSPKNGDLFVLRVIQGLNRFSSFVSLLNNFPLVEVNASLALENKFDEVKQRFNLDSFPKADEINLSVARIPIFPEEFQDIDIMDSTMRSTGAAVLVGSRPAVVLTKASNFMSQFGSPMSSRENKSGPESDLFLTTADKLPMLIFPPDPKELDIEKNLFDRVNPALSPGLNNVASLCGRLRSISGNTIEESLLREAKVEGITDEVISSLTGLERNLIRKISDQQEIKPHLEPMDGGFPDSERKATYISWEPGHTGSPRKPNGVHGNNEIILFLGPGPYKIGWGPEVDQALIQTALALKDRGKKIVLLDNNPDTASRDLDLFDGICMEPPYLEVIESMIDQWSVLGVVHQFCLQVPVGLDNLLQDRGVSVLGTPLNFLTILRDKAELHKQLKEIGTSLLSYSLASDPTQAISEAEKIGYPVLVHLTDRHLNPESGIMYEESMLRKFVTLYQDRITANHPLFLEFYQDGNISAEMLALGDGEKTVQVAFLEHIEEHGIHSGDCATIYPALSVGGLIESLAKAEVDRIVRRFSITGHLQVEFAIRNRNVYVSSVWPYPSRNLPFVQLALENPIHAWVGQLLLGQKISELPEGKLIRSGRFIVKESVFPFSRFPGLDPTLSPRMRSTGQVVGIEDSFGRAYYKSQLSENPKMPSTGKVFVSARDNEKEAILEISKRFSNLGFSLVSTEGTARFLSKRGIKVALIHKISEGRPNIVDLIINGEISMVVNIPGGFRSKVDEQSIHRTAIEHNLPLITTASGAYLMVRGMEEVRNKPISLFPLSD